LFDGATAAATGDTAKAIGCYERILALDIDKELAEAARVRLEKLRGRPR
jgi:hypothetical protein